ncbi:MAG: T9SS type A sorting domain-containing protein [Bacteroidales bacterium]|nr:T9SS type A sorting domain-containing protein [Bacteroidales bacterium]
MKKSLLVISVILFFSVNNIIAQSFSYNFEKPEIITNAQGLTEFNYVNCHNFGEEGSPLMPHQNVSILIPQGKEITNIQISSITYYPEINNIKIKPGEREFPLSFNVERYAVTPNPDIYNSVKLFPKNKIENISTHFLAGHSIGSFTICPVEYLPAENKIKLIKEIKIKVQTQQTSKAQQASKYLRKNGTVEQRISKIVDNSEYLKNYSYSENRNTDVDILLLTNDALAGEFSDYIDFKTSTGYIVETVTVENIYTLYSGQDDAEKVRNCVIDYYQNHNLLYVILGGDADPANSSDMIIPYRGFYANAYGEIDNNIPCDLYFSNLDGTWDDNGNGVWGEVGEDDLYSEVAIARMSVDAADEIENFIHKLEMYQNNPVVDDIEKSLMLGELLWNDPTWGGDYKDEIAQGSSAHGYTTTGVSSNFSISYLYERDMSYNKNDIFDQFNNTGINLLNHLGHSNTNYNMLMYTSDITTTNFTNDGVTRGYVIGYSQGCYNGSFDNRGTNPGSYGTEDCFSEELTTLETGEVACVGNSRYGWGAHASTNGSSQYFDRQFYDAIFGEDITKIGEANADSKEDNISYLGMGAIRWCYYETNLFGDPTMDVWTATPVDMIATYSPSICIGVSQMTFQTDAPYARFGLMQNGVIIGRGIADSDGNATIDFFDPISNPENIQLSIIAHNKNRLEDVIVVITDQPYVIYDHHDESDTAGNGNAILEFGEIIHNSLALKNVGTETANNVISTLSTNNQFITIIDSVENYGNLSAGQTMLIENSHTYQIAENVPDNSIIIFNVEAVGDTSWNSTFSVTVFGPDLNITNLTVDDNVYGNDNGLLDPGETVDISFDATNIGHYIAENVVATLNSNCQFIEIISEPDSIGTLAIDQSGTAIFTISVDESTPNGTVLADLICGVEYGAYLGEETFFEKIGGIIEDYETGDFTKFNWNLGSSYQWTITNQYPYEGSYSAKSYNIPNYASSIITLSAEVTADDSISFIRKVSSEQDYDYLEFYIDDNLKDRWSGTSEGWQREAYAVEEGTHNFKWEYVKDAYVTGGADCAWLDYIILPSIYTLTVYAGVDSIICEGDNHLCSAEATDYVSLEWTTSGSGIFSDITILDPIYTPSENDILSGSVSLILEATNAESNTVEDNLILSFNLTPQAPDTIIGPNEVDLFLITTSEFYTNPVEDVLSYEWNIEPDEAGTITGSDTTGFVEWDTLFNGIAIISVRAINGCGSGNYSEGLEVNIFNTVNINEINEFATEVFPNPFSSQVNISVYLKKQSSLSITIYNSLGEKIESLCNNIINTFGLHKFTFDGSKLDRGIYFCVISTDDKKITKKLILIK